MDNLDLFLRMSDVILHLLIVEFQKMDDRKAEIGKFWSPEMQGLN